MHTSTALTFINEGVANWAEWKASLAETEKLKMLTVEVNFWPEGQINRIFFNCSTTFGLIQEDEAKAEKFLMR